MTTPAPPVPVRPPDVDTGFWLWLTALVLLLIGQGVDLVVGVTGDGAPQTARSPVVVAGAALFLFTVGAVVLTFLLLMRSGYRWTRTLLTGGGLTTVVYTVASLFGVSRPPPAAVAYAATGIFGSVLICGGIYLLHRPDAHRFFVR